MRKFGRPPAKGTKLRRLLLAMLRPEGITHHEIVTGDWSMSRGNVRQAVNNFTDQKGYDIRLVPLSREAAVGRTGSPRGRRQAYRCVGKSRWNGSYRSFVNPKEDRP